MIALVLGSSPTARAMLPVALEVSVAPRIFACNRAIEHVTNPAWLCVADPRAPTAMRGAIESALDRGVRGAIAATVAASNPGLAERPTATVVNEQLHGRRPWSYERGRVSRARLTGVFAVQWAIAQGAAELHLVGMEGYAPGFGYDWRDPSPTMIRSTAAAGVQLLAIVRACPDVAFRWYGVPRYPIASPNVTIHDGAEP